MSDDATLHDRVRKMIVESLRLKIKPEEIADNQAIFETLGLDSIDALELVVAMEKEFGISVTSGDVDRKVFENIKTISAYIKENLKEN